MSLRHELALLKRTLNIVAEALQQAEAEHAAIKEGDAPERSKPQDTAVNLVSESGKKAGDEPMEEMNVDVKTIAPQTAGNTAEPKLPDKVLPHQIKAQHNPDEDPDISGGAASESTAEAKQDEQSQLASSLEQDAADWMQNVPWENSAEIGQSDSDDQTMESDSPRDMTLGAGSDDASDFLSELPWEGSRMPSEQSKSQRSAGPEISDEPDQDASAFFENMDWDGKDVMEKRAPQDAKHPGKVSVEPLEEGDIPEHVQKMLKTRDGSASVNPLRDAIDRSKNSKDDSGEAKG